MAKALKRVQTKRRTPTPAKTTFAGESTCQIHLTVQIFTGSCSGAYQANTFSKGCREGIKNIPRRVEPFRQPIVATLRSIELLDLLLKHDENAAGRVASLE